MSRKNSLDVDDYKLIKNARKQCSNAQLPTESRSMVWLTGEFIGMWLASQLSGLDITEYNAVLLGGSF